MLVIAVLVMGVGLFAAYNWKQKQAPNRWDQVQEEVLDDLDTWTQLSSPIGLLL